MKFSESVALPAPLGQVERMYHDAAFAPEKYRRLGLEGVESLAVEDCTDRFSISCRYSMMQAGKAPEFVRKLLQNGSLLSVRHTYGWEKAARTGWIAIDIEQMKSLSIRCATALAAEATGTRLHLDWDVRCTLPLIGSAIEKFISDDIRQKSAADAAATRELLLGYC